METAMTAGLIDESGNLHLPLASALLALAIAACPAPATRAQTVDSSIDSVFAKYSASTPGCAVGVERAGQPVLVRAYGAADLEHGVPNRVDTVFEAGSVSKQFTAASILLLAQDGRLSLQDPVRKYIPELPDYSGPITVAELLGHTSGLRDWGGVEDIAGWPRGDRVYSMDEVLHVAARQGALNYMPGSAWSYTNTGYNLLAIIVERVSGKKLPAFSRERIFVPLGMTHSQWRDDFRRLVRDRAIAYSAGAAGYQQNMPFEDAIGNGGLLTTVGDLLTWNRALSQGALGPFVRAELERRSTLNDGRAVNYDIADLQRSPMPEPQLGIERGSAAIQLRICRSPCFATPPTRARPTWLMLWPIATFLAHLLPQLLRENLRWPNGRDSMPTIALAPL
jgi:CubicO group peptidase (beta-lactamase class C family)